MIEVTSQLRRKDFTLDVSFQAPGTGVTVIFGPSGCGKTTVLRSIAGLEPACTGRVSINGEIWQDAGVQVPVHQRRAGYVFQQPGLFAHLSVRDNLLFASRRRGKESLSLARVEEMLDLPPLYSRQVSNLSGGEQQRVALGRVLLSKPRLLLLDEPLAALDAGAKGKLIPFLESVLHATGIPALYVTHSPDELVRLADHLVLMHEGRVTAAGPMGEVLSALDSPLAGLDDAFSALYGRLARPELRGLATVVSQAGNRLHVPPGPDAPGADVRLRIQARDVSLCLNKPENTSIINVLPAVVEEVSQVSANGQCTVRLNLGGDRLLARISDHSRQQLDIRPGLALYAQVKAVAVVH